VVAAVAGAFFLPVFLVGAVRGEVAVSPASASAAARAAAFLSAASRCLGKPNALWRDDLEKLEHSVCSRPVELDDCLLVLLRRHGAEDEIAVVFYFPLQHCKPEGVSSQHMKLQIYGKRGV
jgi:hypothetical protein